jgi:hypothetical protein
MGALNTDTVVARALVGTDSLFAPARGMRCRWRPS